MFAQALAVCLVVPFFASSVFAQQSCTRTYTVQTGDICDSISAANNVSTYQLAVVNDNIIDLACDNLNPGSTICLGWQGEDCTSTYVVQLGDTCDVVASNYNINSTILFSNNPQLDQDCTNMYVGEVLCISSTVDVPPLPSGGPMPASAIPATSTPAPTDLPYCD